MKKTSQQLILIKICQKVHRYVLKRLAKFEQNQLVGSCFTMSQSVGMKTRFVLEYTYEITHYVRSIPNTLSVEELTNVVSNSICGFWPKGDVHVSNFETLQ